MEKGELGCWRWTGPGRVVLGRGVGFGPECKGAGPRRKKGERAAVDVSGPNWVWAGNWVGLPVLGLLGFEVWSTSSFLFLLQTTQPI